MARLLLPQVRDPSTGMQIRSITCSTSSASRIRVLSPSIRSPERSSRVTVTTTVTATTTTATTETTEPRHLAPPQALPAAEFPPQRTGDTPYMGGGYRFAPSKHVKTGIQGFGSGSTSPQGGLKRRRHPRTRRL